MDTVNTGQGGGLSVGERLPPLESPRATDGASIAWRAPPRGAPVVAFLAGGADSREYVGALADAEPRFRLWNGRPLVVLPPGGGAESVAPTAQASDADPGAAGTAAAAASENLTPAGALERLTILADPEGEAHRRCGVDEGVAALIVADRWGQIYAVERARTERELPGPREIEEWLRYLATQCPECGVPDEPGRGEWSA